MPGAFCAATERAMKAMPAVLAVVIFSMLCVYGVDRKNHILAKCAP